MVALELRQLDLRLLPLQFPLTPPDQRQRCRPLPGVCQLAGGDLERCLASNRLLNQLPHPPGLIPIEAGFGDRRLQRLEFLVHGGSPGIIRGKPIHRPA